MTISAWGSTGNAAFALPMEQAEPDIPSTQNYILCWNKTTLRLEYVPVAVDPVTGDLTPAGNVFIPVTKGVYVGGSQVVGARNTGWTAPTGLTSKATFDPATVTLPDLGQRVAALINALTAHGLIGST